MELITKAELARRIGISRQSIDKAIKKNKLRLVGEGRSAKIDYHDHLTVKYMNDNSSNRIVAKQSKDPDATSKKSTEKETGQEDQFSESSQLRDEKLKIQTKKLKMEMAEQLGELIQRKEVEKSFSLISSTIINYIFPLGDRLSPMIAGIFESTDQDKINEIKLLIDKEIELALNNVKRDVSEAL